MNFHKLLMVSFLKCYKSLNLHTFFIPTDFIATEKLRGQFVYFGKYKRIPQQGRYLCSSFVPTIF